MKYLHLFETTNEFNNYVNSSDYIEPFIGYDIEAHFLSFNATEKPYDQQYLTFEILSDGQIKWRTHNSSNKTTIEYQINDGVWSSVTAINDGKIINVNTGDIVKFKANNDTYSPSVYIDFLFNYFNTTCEFNVYGNIMSLIYGDNFVGQTSFLQDSTYNFCGLFENCVNLISAENLILPATSLTEGCYYGMFRGCTNLETAPELPATTLADYCYSSMFEGCESLTTAPVLPATTLTTECYYQMFYNCTSLVNAPSLPATTLADYCYCSMFDTCTSLTQAPTLLVTSLTEGCYEYMFYDCTSLETAPELPATTLADYCYCSMFHGCLNLTQAPALPATILTDYCYQDMFYGCTSLTESPLLPAITLTDNCYESMFAECENLSTVTCLATDISANNCIDSWLDYVSDEGTFIKNPVMDEWEEGINVPYDWTIIDAS